MALVAEGDKYIQLTNMCNAKEAFVCFECTVIVALDCHVHARYIRSLRNVYVGSRKFNHPHHKMCEITIECLTKIRMLYTPVCAVSFLGAANLICLY